MRSVDPGLPKPGEVIHIDYRPHKAAGGAVHACTDDPQQSAVVLEPKPIKLLQWNIERGYQLDRIIQQLQEIDADVISLQEVDLRCERSGSKDVGGLIAESLGLNYLLICEFEELRSDLRDERSQGGGVHGNAIMTKFDFSSWAVVEHSHHPIDWNLSPSDQPHPLAAQEPRRGRRLTLAADVCTPQGPMRVYCCHLEVFCGILSRVWQFSDVLAHAKQQQQPQQVNPTDQQQQQQEQPIKSSQQQQQQQHNVPRCQAILGDLNTMGHGVARLSPNYCCDPMRWRTLGWSEAQWWQKHVFAVMEPCPSNKYLLELGLSQHVAEAAVNPGFYDPFDVRRDVTLDNPAYRIGPVHLMAGKLDWTLLKGMAVVAKSMGNHRYAASDHKWLLVEVMLLR